MTLDRARELLKEQADLGRFYGGNSAKLRLSKVRREQGPAEIDPLIRARELGRICGFEPITRFGRGLATGRK